MNHASTTTQPKIYYFQTSAPKPICTWTRQQQKFCSHVLNNNQYIHTKRNYRICKRLEYLHIIYTFIEYFLSTKKQFCLKKCSKLS